MEIHNIISLYRDISTSKLIPQTKKSQITEKKFSTACLAEATIRYISTGKQFSTNMPNCSEENQN